MQVLLVAHNLYVEPTSGAARSVRTIMEWLHDGGHDCHAVTSGRHDASHAPDLRAHHDNLGVPTALSFEPGPRPSVRYTLEGVDVLAIETRHTTRESEDDDGNRQFAEAIAAALGRRPDVVFAYGGHPTVLAALASAHRQGARTIYTVRAWGYDHPRFFENADRVLTNSSISVQRHHDRLGLRADWLPSPLTWSEILAPEESRGFVTIVNPSPHKGAYLFARLADMLGATRPDIPILVIQSERNAADLAAIPGLDLARHESIMVSPPLARPSDIYALTRILLVPSLFAEPFGRVAAEAMINGILPLVSTRSALPETVGPGGIVLPVPDWLLPNTRMLPSEAEVQPWFDAVTRLWDDPAQYAAASTAARAAALTLYDEPTLRSRYTAYFEANGPFPSPLPTK